jgi:hypothetical protein
MTTVLKDQSQIGLNMMHGERIESMLHTITLHTSKETEKTQPIRQDFTYD